MSEEYDWTCDTCPPDLVPFKCSECKRCHHVDEEDPETNPPLCKDCTHGMKLKQLRRDLDRLTSEVYSLQSEYNIG